MARVNKLDVVQFGMRGLLFPFRVTHRAGPIAIQYRTDELVVVCVLRNGALYINSFLRHYRLLGVKHFVFLDNGSTDDTVERLIGSGEDITVLETSAPYQAYENTMKLYLAKKYCRGRWCLCADIDELFDYPYSRSLPLAEFLRYLDSRNFNSAITQMLDMFSDTPLSALRSTPEDDLRSTYRFYDVSAIDRSPYNFPIPDKRIEMHKGGIRRTLFATDNGLTKVSLFLMDGKIKPFVYWHHALNARIADVACVLLHFPFVSSFYSKVKDAVQTGRYGHITSDEYEAYWRTLSANPHLDLVTETSRVLNSVDELVSAEFIFVSDAYLDWVASRGRQQACQG